MLIQLGPRVVLVAVLAFLVSLSTSSVAQTAVSSQSIRDVASLSVPPTLTQHFALALGSSPLWDGWGWGKPKPRKLPVTVPEGSSAVTYLAFVGLACLTAIILGKRQKSR